LGGQQRQRHHGACGGDAGGEVVAGVEAVEEGRAGGSVDGRCEQRMAGGASRPAARWSSWRPGRRMAQRPGLRSSGAGAGASAFSVRHSPEEALTLGFPPGDYVPRTLEQKLVCFADKMLDGDRARPFDEEVKRFVKKGHDVQRLRRLKQDVDEAVGGDAESMILNP